MCHLSPRNCRSELRPGAESPCGRFGTRRLPSGAKAISDIAAKRLLVANLKVTHYRRAEQLIQKHATVLRLRTLDALQLSIARDLLDNARVDSFFTADTALFGVAALENIPTINPTTA